MTDVLCSVCDFIRYATSRFNAADLSFSQGFDSALNEATYLVLTTLHLPHDLPPVYAAANLLPDERAEVLRRIHRRVEERIPVAYLTGEAWFAGLAFKVSPDVLIPRSPIAELIERGFEPWLAGQPLDRVLDLCCGSGCIGIAIAAQNPDAEVDLADISKPALALAAENSADHGVSERVEIIQSDGFAALAGRSYDLIVSNPPYVGQAEYAALPGEFSHEPKLALVSGTDGLDLPLQILADAAAHLNDGGLLVLEVGASEPALVECLPDVPFVWIEFERGGSGVAVLDRATLVDCADQFAQAIAERGISA